MACIALKRPERNRGRSSLKTISDAVQGLILRGVVADFAHGPLEIPDSRLETAVLNRQVKAPELRFFRLVIFVATSDEEIDRLHSLLRRADIKEAGEVGEVIGHGELHM